MERRQPGPVRLHHEVFESDVIRPRHSHLEGQAEVCLSGSLFESDFAGRFTILPGEVLLHGRFDSHTARSSGNHLTLLTLPWAKDQIEGKFRVRDPDFLARLAGKDIREAITYLASALEPIRVPTLDWIDLFFADLRGDQSLSMSRWARRHGLRAETISRGFRQEFGVSPKRFALELRARRAWFEIVGSNKSLTRITQELKFADHPHLCRAVRALTARSPMWWRLHPSDQHQIHGLTRSGAGLLIASA